MYIKNNIQNRWIITIIMIIILIGNYSCNQTTDMKNKKPNVVMILIDDGGYEDFKPFGERQYPTPNVQKLAKEGRCFNNFYVPQAICSASRAALLTGCYPGRTGVFAAHGPNDEGLSPDFATIGEVMQKNGYVTACFGKWHIGDQPGRRPHSRGFDESCGLMYSNDMWKYHPEDPEYWGRYPLQYWENGKITIDPVTREDQKMLTTWYTEHAVNFINKHKNEPFLLYLPHSMPHVPVFCSEKFRGKSGIGLYGDVMMELDWSVGQVMQALESNGLEKNTLFVFIGSDNGPWLSYGNRAGITRFREGKATIFDGGVRNPCIIKYPGHIDPNSTSHKAFCSIDLLPTICKLTGSALPENEIDGKNVWELITGQPGAENPHKYYPFSNHDEFQGIISGDGRWKLHLAHGYRTLIKGGKDGKPGTYTYEPIIDTSLFDMIHDPFEKGNVIDLYPEIADKLIHLAEKHQQEFY